MFLDPHRQIVGSMEKIRTTNKKVRQTMDLSPKKTDSPLSNNLRNIILAVMNLKTQCENLFPFWSRSLDVHVDSLVDQLKVERRKRNKRKILTSKKHLK